MESAQEHAIFMLDAHGRVMSWNRGAERLKGYTAAEIVGRHFSCLYPPELSAHADEVLAAAARRGSIQEEGWRLRKDGTRFWADVTVRALRGGDGALLGFAKLTRDVTERRRAEERLAHLADLLAESQRLARIGSWEWDIGSGRGWWSDELCRLFGVQRDFEPSLDGVLDRVHPEDREQVRAVVKRAVRERRSFWLEHRLAHPDAAPLVVLSRGQVVLDADSRPASVRGTVQDISELKRAEAEREAARESERQALVKRESEQHFHVLADSAPVMVWTAGPDGRSTWFNRSWLEFTGRTIDEERNDGWLAGLHPEDRERSTAAYRAAFERREPFRVEYRLRRRDGVHRWVLDHGVPSLGPAGELRGYVGSCLDVTESRLAAEAAARANERLRLLSEASMTLSATLDTESRLAVAARLPVPVLADGAIAVLRRDCGALVSSVHHADPEARRAIEEALARFALQSEPTRAFEALAAARSRPFGLTSEVLGAFAEAGGLRDRLEALGVQQVLALPLQTAGKLAGALLLLQTGRGRRFEPDDVAAAEDLALRASVALDQSRLYAELVQANRLKDDFLATLSHELRTPLNAIVGWTHLLQDGALDADGVRKAVDTIHRNALSQTQMISDILDVSRITTGSLRLTVAPLDVEQVVRTALDSLRPAAAAKGIHVEVLIAGALPVISGDEDRLRQVVWNLVSNAIKFTPRDGRVQVRVERPNSHVALVVEDTGPGIDPEFFPYLFERFRQADRSPSRQQRGLGLGLAIVRHLVELHGGQVTARNRGERSGAVFVVTLPLRSVEEPRAIDAPEAVTGLGIASAPDLAGVRVLVVDDHADARELVATVLARCGAEVVTAASAEAALALLRERRPSVLLADIEMPDQDGYQLIQRVRRLPAEEGGLTPAAALTAFVRPDDRYRALMSGFQMHVAKPVHPAELAAVVASLAGLRR